MEGMGDLPATDPRFEELLCNLTVPTRMYNWAETKGVKTVGELVRHDPRALIQERNVGQVTIRKTRAALAVFLGAQWEEVGGHRTASRGAGRAASPAEPKRRGRKKQPDASSDPIDPFERDGDLVAALRRRWAILDRRTIEVLEQRTGLHGEASTLEAIGRRLGVTRQCIAFREARGLHKLKRDTGWVEAIARRLGGHLASGALTAAELAAVDPWFRAAVEAPDAFSYCVDYLLDGRFAAFDLGGVAHVAAFPMASVKEAWRALDAELAAMSLPADDGPLDAAITRHGARLGEHVVRWLRARAEALVGRGADGLILYIRRGVRARIDALLRANPEPVSIQTLQERFGRHFEKYLPPERVRIAEGMVTLPEHLEGFAAWAPRLASRCARWMREHGPDRLWSRVELFEVLRELRRDRDLPPWLTPGSLEAALSQSGGLRSVGGNCFTLPEADLVRVNVGEVFAAILADAGHPLPGATLRARAQARRGCSSRAAAAALRSPIFVETAPGRWGLAERDLPGGGQAADAALEAVASALGARRRGMGLDAAFERVRPLSAHHACWTVPTLRSVLRRDRRFVLTVQGTVGLAVWGDAHAPARGALVRECLDASGGRTTVAAVQARIAEVYERPLPPASLHRLLWAAGARVQGEEVVRDRGSEGG